MAADQARARQVWIVTDGRAGIENQARGLAEALARRVRLDVVRLHAPPARLVRAQAPTLRDLTPVDARVRDAFWATQAMARTPWPDVWIGCGRASLGYSRRARGWTQGASLIVQLQKPPGSLVPYDLVIAPRHDGLEESDQVFNILGSTNRILPPPAQSKDRPVPAAFARLKGPRVAVLIGGNSKRHRVSSADARALLEALDALRAKGAGLMVTTSRRTPATLIEALKTRLRAPVPGGSGGAETANVTLWTGAQDGPNPYFDMLACADAALVTLDSTNMLTEAASAGVPVLGFALSARPGKFARLYDELIAREFMRPFSGVVETWDTEPLRETDRAAQAVLDRLESRASREVVT